MASEPDERKAQRDYCVRQLQLADRIGARCAVNVADAAAVGRSMLPALEAEGAFGVETFIRKVTGELRFIMSYTGFGSIDKIDDSCIIV